MVLDEDEYQGVENMDEYAGEDDDEDEDDEDEEEDEKEAEECGDKVEGKKET